MQGPGGAHVQTACSDAAGRWIVDVARRPYGKPARILIWQTNMRQRVGPLSVTKLNMAFASTSVDARPLPRECITRLGKKGGDCAEHGEFESGSVTGFFHELPSLRIGE